MHGGVSKISLQLQVEELQSMSQEYERRLRAAEDSGFHVDSRHPSLYNNYCTMGDEQASARSFGNEHYITGSLDPHFPLSIVPVSTPSQA